MFNSDRRLLRKFIWNNCSPSVSLAKLRLSFEEGVSNLYNWAFLSVIGIQYENNSGILFFMAMLEIYYLLSLQSWQFVEVEVTTGKFNI